MVVELVVAEDGGDTVVVSTVVVRLVGRTGGAAFAELVVEVVDAGQLAEPHSRSVGQQPPPRDAGQERKPEEQVRLREVEAVTVTVLVTVRMTGGRGDVLLVVDEVEVVVVGVEVDVVDGVDTEGVTVV